MCICVNTTKKCFFVEHTILLWLLLLCITSLSSFASRTAFIYVTALSLLHYSLNTQKYIKKKSNIIAFCVSQAAITHSCNTQQNKKAHETKKNIFICIHIIHFLSRRVLPFIHNNREYREYD